MHLEVSFKLHSNLVSGIQYVDCVDSHLSIRFNESVTMDEIREKFTPRTFGLGNVQGRGKQVSQHIYSGIRMQTKIR